MLPFFFFPAKYIISMSHFNPDDRKKYLKFLYAWPCPRKFSEGLQSCRPYRDKIYVKQAIGSKGKTKNTVLKQERTWHTKGTAEIGFSLPRRQFEKEIELKCSCFEASDYWLKVWWCRLQQMRNSISDSTGNTTSPPQMSVTDLGENKSVGGVRALACRRSWLLQPQLGVMPIYHWAPFWQVIKMGPLSSLDVTWWETASNFL